MTPEKEVRAQLAASVKALSDLVNDLGEVPFGLTPQCVQFVDGFVSRNREELAQDPETLSWLEQIVGAFLGEALIAQYGGDWCFEAHQYLGVKIEDGFVCFPFVKARKHVAHGEEDSIEVFFRAMGSTLTRRRAERGEVLE